MWHRYHEANVPTGSPFSSTPGGWRSQSNSIRGQFGDKGKFAAILQICMPTKRGQSYRSIHRAGVQKIKRQPLRDRQGDRRLSSSSGSVDRYDHDLLRRPQKTTSHQSEHRLRLHQGRIMTEAVVVKLGPSRKPSSRSPAHLPGHWPRAGRRRRKFCVRQHFYRRVHVHVILFGVDFEFFNSGR